MIGTEEVTSDFSPVRKRAWDVLQAEEGLLPYSLGRACRVLWDEVSVKECLSFDVTDEAEKETWSLWLQDEIEHANRC